MSTSLVSGHSFPNRKSLLHRRSQSLLDSSSADRRQMLLPEQELWSSSPHARHNNRRFNEVVGGTTADIAAVACAPLGIADLVLLAVYKVPTGLCRKAIRQKRRRRLMKKGSLNLPFVGHDQMCYCSYCDGMESEFQTEDPVMMAEAMEKDDDLMQLEKEMWDKFHGAGFWRSNSAKIVTVGS
ncbi:uncharacterized protein LOC141713962 [Apium graveolens]|uniref:uncharacterized protein LOC141713962 n=1 Tax=Apium graveolens TaxID=4045 RepID=UPI003D7A9D68